MRIKELFLKTVCSYFLVPFGSCAHLHHKVSLYVLSPYSPYSSTPPTPFHNYAVLPSVRRYSVVPVAVNYTVVDVCKNLQFFATTLQPLDLSHHPGIFAELAARAPHLVCLGLQCLVTGEVMTQVADAFPKLKAAQFGSFGFTSSFPAERIVYLLERCPQLEALVILKDAHHEQYALPMVTRAGGHVRRLKSLVIPYAQATDVLVHEMEATDLLRGKIELNFGCDTLTMDGIEILFKHCDALEALSVTVAGPDNLTRMLRVMANEEETLPRLAYFGMRSHVGTDPHALVALAKARPNMKIYNYAVRNHVTSESRGEWCYKPFDFYYVCCRADVLPKACPL